MDNHRDKMELALSADVRRIASGKMAVLLSIESGFDQRRHRRAETWHRLGVRFVQFAGQVTTAYADSSVRGEAKWGGINDRGRRLITEMNRLGMVIDVTHATKPPNARSSTSRAPVVASHVAMRAVVTIPATCPMTFFARSQRKRVDWSVFITASVIGQRYFDWSRRIPPVWSRLHFWMPPALNLDSPAGSGRRGRICGALDARMRGLWRSFYANRGVTITALPLVPTMEEWTDHVTHVIKTVGPSHVAIGLDSRRPQYSQRFRCARLQQLGMCAEAQCAL